VNAALSLRRAARGSEKPGAIAARRRYLNCRRRWPDGTLVIVGSRKADQISIAVHFPGLGIFDVFVNDLPSRHYAFLKDIWIDAGGGNDTVVLSVIPGTVYGGRGNDTITGGTENDTLHGGPGRDTLWGSGGADLLLGDTGNDAIDAGAGDNADRLFGGTGNATLNGGAGDDQLSGDAGRDSLDGGNGNDDLTGGSATDLVTGGAGTDEFSESDADSELVDFAVDDTRTLP
jgi:Ca2+-binding RTX toxin-like protein